MYIFPLHYDSGNRGCEAIAKGTSQIIDCGYDNIIAYTTNKDLDLSLGLGKLEQLILKPKAPGFFFRCYNKIQYILLRNQQKHNENYYEAIYRPLLKECSHNDFLFITGGDTLCYEDNEINYFAKYSVNNGNRIVLWGCSVGRENITKSKAQAISEMSLVTARESITYELIKNEFNKNVYCVPDPAFVLKPECIDLTSFDGGNNIGLNLSKFFLSSGLFENDINNSKINNIYNFIDYVINNTDLSITLIPHTFWEGQDDRIVCEKVKDHYKESDRVQYYNTEKLNYCQIRYLISKCRFFIGARTHSVISAYSTCVPTLALGYSVKSIGIAKDLGLPSELVLDTRNLTNEDELLERFKYLYKHEDEIRAHLEDVMPSYVAKAWQAKDALKTIE